MTYAFEHREPVEAGVRRIIGEELDGALAALDAGVDGGASDAVHEFRKRSKKVRAVARLVRPAMGDHFERVNTLARDAARELSALRDATALTETFDRLASIKPLRRNVGALDRVRGLVIGPNDGMERLAPDLPEIVRARELVAELMRAVDRIELDAEGWGAIGPGLRTTYRRGRQCLRETIDEPTAEHFHEWRKRAKYTRHHLGLLIPSAPGVLEPLENEFHRLTASLGDAHDLHVLESRIQTIRAGVTRRADAADLDTALAAVAGATAELETRAIALGRELYADRPKRLVRRLGGFWDAWYDGRDPEERPDDGAR